MKIYQVGGAVRDYLLNKNSKDIDYAVEAESYQEMYDYINKNGTIWQERPEFFTIRAKLPGLGDADFVLCRKDGNYSDGRHPDVVEVGTIYDDLARRDFTMNAIAMDMDSGKFIDPYYGRKDIRRKIINVVGGPERFKEDSLRLLRALRFSVTLEFFVSKLIDDCLRDWKLVQLLDNVSTERIMEELNKMFRHNTWRTTKILYQYDVLRNQIFSDKRLQLVAKVIE